MIYRLVRFLFYTFLTLSVLGSLAFAGAVFYFNQELPDHTQLKEYHPNTLTRFYTADGRLLAEYAKEKRIFVPVTSIPEVVKNAFIAAEDRSFYYNVGLDFIGIARAVKNNLLNDARLQGASTITQQVAKNMLLSNERTLTRKVKEAILAVRMTFSYSKEKILELYLNEIYLGNRSYGVAAAALNYFNKSIDELNVEEAALLAALPKAPSRYNPWKNYEDALTRRNWVVQGMAEEGFISQPLANFAKRKPIILHPRSNAITADGDYFAEEVRRNLVALFGEEKLYTGGLVVHTTLDPDLQTYAERALREGLIAYTKRHGYRGALSQIELDSQWHLRLQQISPPRGIEHLDLAAVLRKNAADKFFTIGLKNGKVGSITYEALKWAQQNPQGTWVEAGEVLSPGDVILVEPIEGSSGQYALRQIPQVNGALVALDPHNGHILAMAGGYSFERSRFNRATQAMRQPGSAFKPFVYLQALRQGYTPADLLADEPIEFEILKPIDRNAAAEPPPLPEVPAHITDPQEQIAFLMDALEEQEEAMSETEIWAPRNYSGHFYGPTTLRRGVEKSLNVMTVHLATVIGLGNVVEIANLMDIHRDPPRNMSVVLGAAETSLIRLTRAYASLVNGGKKIRTTLIDRIQNRNGATIYRNDRRECVGCAIDSESRIDGAVTTVPVIPDTREQLLDPRIAYQMVSVLEGVVQRGTGRRARAIGKPIAGKTGTTNDSRDAWFVGFSPDLVVGVYIGFDTPKSLGKKEEGSSAALPIFVDFMNDALADTPATPFRIPSGMKLVKVDGNTGFLPSGQTTPRDIVLEAFLSGQEPTRAALPNEALPVINAPKGLRTDKGSDSSTPLIQTPVTRGTGGIY